LNISEFSIESPNLFDIFTGTALIFRYFFGEDTTLEIDLLELLFDAGEGLLTLLELLFDRFNFCLDRLPIAVYA
jgi:hypothetical protein